MSDGAVPGAGAGSPWPRDQWEIVADDLLARAHAHLHRLTRRPAALGRWPASSDHLVGFARSFLLASYRLAHPARPPADDLADRFAVGLVDRLRGTDRRRWPDPDDGQAAVYEAAILATALHESRPHVWDRLAPADRERAVTWLIGAHRARTYDNNWTLAPVVVADFLASVGAEIDAPVVERSLERVERWHRGDGCYTDGPDPAFDHYWAWGMHQFLAQHQRMTDRPDPAYRDRLRAFLERYRRTIDPTGAPLHVGRSLSYRCAVAGVFWMGELLDATPLTQGQTRAVTTAVASWFTDRGAFAAGPAAGWQGAWPAMADPYTTSMAPYLCGLGFAGLLLPAEHPVWTAHPEPWWDDGEPERTTLGDTGQTLLAAGGVVRVAGVAGAARTDRAGRPDPRYAKLGYSSATGPEWGRPGRWEPDNEVVIERGRHRHRRGTPSTSDGRSHTWAFTDGQGGGTVRSVSAFVGELEVRAHRVETEGAAEIVETGYAVAGRGRPAITTGGSWVCVSGDEATVLTASLLGHTSTRSVRHRGSNPFGDHSAVGRLQAEITGGSHLVVSAHLIRRSPIDPTTVLASVTVGTTTDGRCRVRYEDDEVVLDL